MTTDKDFQPRSRTPGGTDPVPREPVAADDGTPPLFTESVEPLIGVEEASRILGVTRRTVYVWAQERRIPHYKPGGMTMRFRASELNEWLQRRAVRERA